MVVKLNTVRLNGASLNSASLNGVGDRLRASAGGGGGEVIPPEEPDVPDVPVTYTLSASASNGVVSASVNGKAVTLPVTANEGDVVVVEVTANDGYVFEGWSDGSTDNPRTITMHSDVTLSATCVVKAVEKEYIQFEDAEVERVLMSKGVSSDGVGITKEDAAAVTGIGEWFYNNTVISFFNEFTYFTGVTSLGYRAFQGCTSLQEITLPVECTNLEDGSVNYGTFRGCTSLRKVVANGLTSLGYGAFQNCSALSDISIAWANVTKVNTNAFNGCTALSFDYLNLVSLETLGINALNGVKVKKLNLGKVMVLPSAAASSQNYGDKSVLEEVVLSDSLASIPNFSFDQYLNLRKIEGVGNVVTIGEYSFRKTAIEEFIAPSATTLPRFAFTSCTNLKSIDVGSIAEVGIQALQLCSALEKVVIRATTPPTMGNAAFVSTNDTFLIYVPDASLEAYRTATNWNTYADRIHPLSEIEGSPYIEFEDPEVERVLMENNVSSDGVGITMADAEAVTSIGTWFRSNKVIESFEEFECFTGITTLGGKYTTFAMSSLKEVSIPASVETLTDDTYGANLGAFRKCASLTTIGDTSHIKKLGRYSFESCSAFSQDVNMPSLEGTIGYMAMYGVAITRIVNLGKAEVLEGVATASVNSPQGPFARCQSLIEAHLPATLKEIRKGTFGFCTALTTLIIDAVTPPTLDANAWYGSNALAHIYVPDAAVEAYKAAANWSTYADRIKPLSEYVES